MDKIFIPVNINNNHWACVVIFFQEERIQYYDSLGWEGVNYMKAVFQYLQDEWMEKHDGQKMPNVDRWKLVSTTTDTPKQENGFDCGVYTCMYADF